MRKLFPYFLYTLCFLLLSSGILLGQEATPSPAESLFWLMVFVLVGISVVCIVLSFTILALISKAKAEAPVKEQVKQKVYVEEPDFWQKAWKKLTSAVPVARESEIDMGHDYDGIRELDNKLPPWWLYGFYLSIIISVFYLYYYHIGNDWSSDQEYRQEMAEGEKIRQAYLAKVANLVNEETVSELSSKGDLTAGKAIYTKNCVACHGNMGQGGIGPNLTDPYWLHGGGIKNVFKTVKYGVIERGMTPWQDILKPQEIQQVSSYILTLADSNPPEAKDPQGELWKPEDENPTDTLQVISMNP